MPRRVQDIVPNDRRSIRDVVLPKTKDIDSTRERVPLERKSSRIKDELVLKIHKKNSVSEDKETLEKKEQMRRVVMTPSQRKKNSFKKKGLPIAILSVVVVIILAGFIASRYFSRAVFTITPKVFPVAVSNTLVIKPGVTADLSYDVITMKTSQSVTVSAIDGQVFSAKAEGTVNVYNAFSTSSVRLIAGTRLSGDSGLIYRLKSSIVIPGYTKSDGSIVAGKMATPIIADQPGSNYNMAKSDMVGDLKAVAYKGGNRYDTIYARLASDVTGGLLGAKKTVVPSVMASSTASLKSSLLSTLLKQVKGSVPNGYILYDTAYSSAFNAPIVSGTEKNKAVITIQGTVYGIIFKKFDLVAKLAGLGAVSGFSKYGYTSPGLEELSFAITNMKDFAPEKKGTLIVNMKGDMKLIGTIPVDELKKSLAGKSLADSQNILKIYSAVIENADGELVPPWSKIPLDASRITINVKSP